MSLVHGRLWWWNFFKQLLFDLHAFVRGTVVLSYGYHEVFIQTDPNIVPQKLYLACTDDHNTVCVGDVSTVGQALLPNGFIIFANIKSNATQIDYLLEYVPAPDANDISN